MSSGYNKAREQALQLGKEAYKNGARRLCFDDAELKKLYDEWKERDTRRAIKIGEQWYRGWDRANLRDESNVS